MFMVVLLLSLYTATLGSPLMGALTLTLTSLVMGATVACYMNIWAGYSTILLYVGGLMVLFLYVCGFSSASKFFSQINWIPLFVLACFTLLSSGGFYVVAGSLPYSGLPQLYHLGSKIWISSLVIILLVALFVCVILCLYTKGPLKSKASAK